MFRDKTHLLKMIKMRLGIYSITLPVDDKKLYQDVIVDMSIPVFSEYLPYPYHLLADLDEMRVHDRYGSDDASLISNVYQIPELFDGLRCLGIAGMHPHNEYNGMMMTGSYETIESYQTLAIGQTLANLSSTMVPPQTYQFLPPNRFRIYNQILYNNKVDMDLNYTHSPELFTIPDTARDSFFKLALLDTKIYLYQAMKYYASMQTAIGTMDLKIDAWENAESERQELLDKWDDTYHLDSCEPIIYI